MVRFSGEALTAGVERQTIDGVSVPVYSATKTVADCFEYRNKIGVDVAVESLRRRRATVDGIWCFAVFCRVANVMRPYLEAIQ